MNQEYSRPATIEEALKLLKNTDALPLYGANASRAFSGSKTIVDLQNCGPRSITVEDDQLLIGACATLQDLLDHPALPAKIKEILMVEERQNLRNMTAIADVVLYADGLSLFLSTLLALDAKVMIAGHKAAVPVGDIVALGTDNLILEVVLPLKPQFAYESVSRTPMDKPVVLACLAKWPGERVRLVLGGYGKKPVLVVDGKGSFGVDLAAASAFAQASDPKASAEYRSEMAKLLTINCIEKIKG